MSALDIAIKKNNKDIVKLLQDFKTAPRRPYPSPTDETTNNETTDERIQQLEKELKKAKEELIQAKSEIQLLKNAQKKSESKTQSQNSQFIDPEMIETMKKVREIGSVGNGRVFEVIKEEKYALKVMNITEGVSESKFQRFFGEYEMLNQLHHENIVKTYGFCFGKEGQNPSILLEYCPKNLSEVIKKNELNNVQKICVIYQIAKVFKYIHSMKIIHRDLKPTNILIDNDGIVKICDFGIAKLLSVEQQSQTGGVGTIKFMSPEMLDENNYNEKVDVYAFGVLIFFILTNGAMPDIKMSKVLTGGKAKIPNSLNKFTRKLIDSCWNFDPNDRPSFDEICQSMKKEKYQLINLEPAEQSEVLSFVKNH